MSRAGAFVLAGLLLAACADDLSTAEEEIALVAPRFDPASPDEALSPLPPAVELDPRKVALGDKLFHDAVLSPDDNLTCSTCHQLDRGGEDGRPKSDLPGKPPAVVNTPTLFNTVFNFRFHWSGSFDELEAQLKVPVESPRVMATTFDAIVERLKKKPEYVSLFSRVYEEGITVSTFKDALVHFERSLVTPDSRLDKYLRGDASALDDLEKKGLALFKSHGCVSCHQGVNVGGNMFQKLGVMREFFEERGDVTDADLGRWNVTKREEDRHVFRVPSLRNVAVTAPYLHDGSAETLEEAVQIMSEYQLGRPLERHQLEAIVAFLRTLTGEYRGEPLR